MLGDLDTPPFSFPGSPAILNRSQVKTCHIVLPDMPKPMGAIVYENRLYSFVKAYPTLTAAQTAAHRLIKHGNHVVLTEAPRGLVLWVFEPDAKPSR